MQTPNANDVTDRGGSQSEPPCVLLRLGGGGNHASAPSAPELPVTRETDTRRSDGQCGKDGIVGTNKKDRWEQGRKIGKDGWHLQAYVVVTDRTYSGWACPLPPEQNAWLRAWLLSRYTDI